MALEVNLGGRQLVILLVALVLLGVLTFLAGMATGARLALRPVAAEEGGTAEPSEAAPGPSDGEGAPQTAAGEAGPPERIYELQLSAHLDREDAEPTLQTLAAAGYEAFIVETRDSKGRTLYTVRVGPWDTMADAAEAARAFSERSGLEELTPVIRHRPKPVLPGAGRAPAGQAAPAAAPAAGAATPPEPR